MNLSHKELAAGRWQQLSLLEEMANIGSEVSRALNWQQKGNNVYCQKATERALELLTLTLETITILSQYKEIARLREVIVDYFFGTNQFLSTEVLWRKYFDNFNYAARKNH